MKPGRLSRRERVLLLALATGLLTLLAIATRLTPDARGLGTHQQLGLPPCTFFVLFGRPCPSCGMTTAWTYVVRGQLAAACGANAGGALLAILAVVAAPWILLAALCGRWIGPAPGGMTALVTGSVLAAVVLIQWVWRLLGGG